MCLFHSPMSIIELLGFFAYIKQMVCVPTLFSLFSGIDHEDPGKILIFAFMMDVGPVFDLHLQAGWIILNHRQICLVDPLLPCLRQRKGQSPGSIASSPVLCSDP